MVCEVMLSPIRRTFLLILICLIAGTSARADEYAWELSGLAGRADLDPLLDADQSAIAATYHFAHVDDTKGPLALASFLDPQTRIAASIGRDRQTTEVALPPGVALTLPHIESESVTYVVSGRYVLPAKKWYAGGRYVQTNRDVDPGSLLTNADGHGATVFAGRYLGVATTLDLSLDRAVDETQGTGIACISSVFCAAVVPQSIGHTRDTATLSVLHMWRFRSLTYTLGGSVADSSGQAVIHSGSFDFSLPSSLFPPGVVFLRPPVIKVPAHATEVGLDRYLIYSVGAELFPTRKLGLRVGYAGWDDSSTLDYAYDIAATWFVSRNIGLRFVLGRQHAHANLDDTDVAAVEATGRF
jgi:hypothetical protein